MARVHFVKCAQKPNPVVSAEDIERAKAGEEGAASYYFWKPFKSQKRYSKKKPRPSQVSTSRWAEILAAEEDFHDALAEAKTMEDLRMAVEDAQSVLEEFAGECEEAADAMEENFPGSEQAEQIRERATVCEEFKDGELDQFELDDDRTQCDICEGEGKVECDNGHCQDGTITLEYEAFSGSIYEPGDKCPVCEGTGKIDCDDCVGTGVDPDAFDEARDELLEACWPPDPY